MANVDIRRLKDQAADFLGKSKYAQAAEILEQLIRAEPRDMQHRLKLGDTYRRLGSDEKAIGCYQVAGRHFGDESQLIKAIGAFKVILEIDPENEAAQRDLSEMNSRRFAKPSLEMPGRKGLAGIGAGARGVSELELAEGEHLAANIGQMLEVGRGPFDDESSNAHADEEPLELDLPPARGGKKQSTIAPAKSKGPPTSGVFRSVSAAGRPNSNPTIIGAMGQPLTPIGELEGRRGPAPKIRPAIELGGSPELELDLEVPQIEMEVAELEPLEEGAPAPSAPSTAWKSGPLPSKRVAIIPPPVMPLPARPPPPPPESVSLADEIEIDGSDEEVVEVVGEPDSDLLELESMELTPTKGAAKAAAAKADSLKKNSPPNASRPVKQASSSGTAPRPIADLLVEEYGEEIELISISSDGEEPAREAAKQTGAGLVSKSSPPQSPSASSTNARASRITNVCPIASNENAAGASPPAPKGRRPVTREEVDAAFNALAPAAAPKPASRKLARVPLFDDLPQQAFLELVNRLSYKRYEKGETILREGDPGRSFFVIVEGSVRVFKKLADGQELQLASLGEGAFFGEMALLSGAPRTANVAAETQTELLEISDQVLRQIVGKYPSVAQSLKNFYRQRLVNNVMAISPLFKEFEPGERRLIVERFKMKQAGSGEEFIHEGQDSDGLYVVLHGCARVMKKLEGGREVELAQLKEGELFGEMSLLTSEPATATVTAQGPVILLKLAARQFQELILTHPQILELVSDLTDRRAAQIRQVLSGHGPGHDGMSFV